MFTAVLVLLVGASLVARQDPPQGTTFRSSSRTVAIYATVTDGSGRLVPDLEQKHFEIYDNGKLQPLTIFKSVVQPNTVVAKLETSGSMTLNLDLMKESS
jgi:hypothetical protein